MPACKQVALVLCSSVALIVLVAQAFTVEVRSQQQQQQQVVPDSKVTSSEPVGEKRELPQILDFAKFKKIFKKRYVGGWREELVRCKLFLSRAMRTVLAAMRYQTGLDTYYLAINEMSDSTSEERQLMNNKQLEEFVKQERDGSTRQQTIVESGPPRSKVTTTSPAKLPEFYLADTRPESILAELARHTGERATEELRHLGEPVTSRKKREVPSDDHARRRRRRRRRRALTMDNLIRLPDGGGIKLSPLAKEKMRTRVPSNNPNYETQVEPLTMGLADQQEPVNYVTLNPGPTGTFSNFLALVSEQTAADPMDIDSGNYELPQEMSLPVDEIYTDLRRTNCFLTPRNQGTCGCCYAFSMIAITEFLHCIKTGQLVAFSEQYMLDCGPGNVANLRGCHGGGPTESGQFVHNFGMELRVNYPYLASESQCPYAPDVDLKTTGYIRTEIGNGVKVDVQLWPEYLHYGPMWVGIMTSGDDFIEYAGGVHRPNCAPQHGYHAMVLIGHGREDGLEYWLFRNSYGPGWGEAGHYKMAARSTACIVTPGFMYGTLDGRQYEMNLERNGAYDGRYVGLNYVRNMMGDQQAFGLV